MKPTLALIHGWAMSSAIWDPILDDLRESFEVFNHDLPGYGKRTGESGERSLEELTADAIERIPEGAIWLGWSLGGMIAMNAAKQPNRSMKGLILICTTPKFANEGVWSVGVEPELIDGLEEKFKSEYSSAIKRFLLLQVGDPKRGRSVVSSASASCESHPAPNQATLMSGLNILRQADLRSDLAQINCPVELVAGTGDTIVPVGASRWLEKQIYGSRLTEFEAGHLPFLESRDEFLALIKGLTNNSTANSKSETPTDTDDEPDEIA